MVFLTYVRKIDVANLVFVVKVDEERTVTDRDISHLIVKSQSSRT